LLPLRINRILKRVIDERTDPWGIEVSAFDVKDLDLPKSMKRAMARQAEAERERRAKVINAQGELQASETLAQAARTLAIEPERVPASLSADCDRDRGRAQLHDDLPDPPRALPPIHPRRPRRAWRRLRYRR
jgi:hypothetical protein